MAFTHLHVHTAYSLLDGASRIKDLFSAAKEMGQKSIAITDHGVMYGAMEFYRMRDYKEDVVIDGVKQTIKPFKDIKPIIGCEIYMTSGSRFDREKDSNKRAYYHLVLLAKDLVGYHNLVRIVSIGHSEGFYNKPRVDYEILEKYHEGLIALSACLAGEVAQNLLHHKYDDAVLVAKRMNNIFGQGNYFLEMQDHGKPDDKRVNAQLKKISDETGIPIVCTNDSHYTYKDDPESHQIMLLMQTGKTRKLKSNNLSASQNNNVNSSDESNMDLAYEGGQFYLKSEEEMRELFKEYPEALANTQVIADMCNLEIPEFTMGKEKYKIPVYETPNGETAGEYLSLLAHDGLAKRYENITPEIKERLEYELSQIDKLGFSGYFLTVWDFINYAKTNGIAVGPGRGSGAGSIVAYCIGITEVDPIKYELIFERFLNPERVSMPDFDIDFCVIHRDDVIDYVRSKYGDDHVSQIVTFGSMKAKQVIRDVGRVLDVNYGKCNDFAKLIPKRDLGITLSKMLYMDLEKLRDNGSPEFAADDKPNVQEFRRLVKEDFECREIIKHALKLEGLPKSAGVHASGVLIAPKAVTEFVPIARAKKNAGSAADPNKATMAAEYDMTTLEALGLLKFDFLGLRNLTAIQNTCKMVEERHNIKIDFAKMNYDDKNVFDLISSGDTMGVFQLESAGMTKFMKQLKPNCLEDVIAGISLFRPGPMDFIPTYVENKHNPSKIHYDTPKLEPILKPTYGCIVYQEQVMQIVRDLAGYSMGRSDLVRRAMAKKHKDELDREEDVFVNGSKEASVPGCIANGIDELTARKIFDDMKSFASYAFNKSHAAAYATVAYQTAYLKKYYPLEFIAALCNSVIDKRDQLDIYINYAKQSRIKILRPDINASGIQFTVDGDSLRIGFAGLLNVGTALAELIVDERQENGPYHNLDNFVIRTSKLGMNKKALERLILVGAFDCFTDHNRRQKYLAYDELLEAAKKRNTVSKIAEGQNTLLDFFGDSLPVNEQDQDSLGVTYSNVEEYTKEEIYYYEREISGIFISGHPLDAYAELVKNNANVTSLDFHIIEEETDEIDTEDNGNIENKSIDVSQGEQYEKNDIHKGDKQVCMGGIITEYSIKTSKNGSEFAKGILEDQYGEVTFLIFSKSFKQLSSLLSNGAKVFLRGNMKLDNSGAYNNQNSDEEGTSTNDVIDYNLIVQDAELFDASYENQKEINIVFPSVDAYGLRKKEIDNAIDTFRSGYSKIYVYVQVGQDENGKGKYKSKFLRHFAVENADEITQILTQRLGTKSVYVRDL